MYFQQSFRNNKSHIEIARNYKFFQRGGVWKEYALSLVDWIHNIHEKVETGICESSLLLLVAFNFISILKFVFSVEHFDMDFSTFMEILLKPYRKVTAYIYM